MDFSEITETVEELRSRLDAVYAERNLIVALALKLAYLNGWAVWMAEDDYSDCGPQWKNVVFAKMPSGQQLSWHIHASEVSLFGFLKKNLEVWDGHDTERKYGAIRKFVEGI